MLVKSRCGHNGIVTSIDHENIHVLWDDIEQMDHNVKTLSNTDYDVVFLRDDDFVKELARDMQEEIDKEILNDLLSC